MKVLSIVGTRPNFTKEATIQRAAATRDVEIVLVHTGQHYDFKMSAAFFEELAIPTPAYHLDTVHGTSVDQLAAMLPALEKAILRERPDVVLVYGDVTSTAAGAWAGTRAGFPVAHVEAGVRTLSRYNPEEINRRVADHLSDVNLANVTASYENLLAEGFAREDVFLPGDIVCDALQYTLTTFGVEPRRGDYDVLTMHRAENTDDPHRLARILKALRDAPRPVRFPCHPRTLKAIQAAGLDALLESPTIQTMEPMGYRSFVELMAGANKVISDSGGVRREAYILAKPVVSLIDFVWVPEMVDCGWEFVAGADREKILHGLVAFEPPDERPEIFGDGHAAPRILDILLERYAP